ncbi:hypothetical protein BJV82DRAFT_612827 [Fennellomyces sp. T-0311]|nr:hypothetical protein BJV82DRAFT_612827 [Fennellomyces sp. T-0311]
MLRRWQRDIFVKATCIPCTVTKRVPSKYMMPVSKAQHRILLSRSNELPVEVASVIFSELDQEDKVSCLKTSNIWRSRLLDCSSAWKTLSVIDNEGGAPLMAVAEQIGRHVKTLEVWTDWDPVRKICFDRMEQGCFNQINSLKMTADEGEFLQSFTAIPSRFWKTAHALQKLEFDLTESESEITIANILGSCPTVTELSYSITALQKLKFGDFSTMKPHTSLTSLKLKAHRITGEMIEPLLQQCPNLKRLIANECQPTVLNAVHKCCPNMQVLAYNAVSQVDQYLPTDEQTSGLRVLYANDHGTGRVPYESLMPLLYKSMDTLVNVFVFLPAMSENDRRYVYDNYPDFKLPKVERLSFWPLHGIQRFMLQAIQDTTTLRHLSVASVNDLDELTTALMNLRPLETFRLAHIHTRSHQESFVKLFERYAILSKTGVSLKSPTIRHCNEITDEVLLSMAKIETLRNIAFVRLRNITSGGLNAFFKALQGKPIFVRLGEMDFVTDDVVIGLAKVETLETIHLENLRNLTDRGLQGLIDNRSRSLSKLIIKECPMISRNGLEYAKGRVKISLTGE